MDEEPTLQSDGVEPDPNQVDPYTTEAEQPIWQSLGGDH